MSVSSVAQDWIDQRFKASGPLQRQTFADNFSAASEGGDLSDMFQAAGFKNPSSEIRAQWAMALLAADAHRHGQPAPKPEPVDGPLLRLAQRFADNPDVQNALRQAALAIGWDSDFFGSWNEEEVQALVRACHFVGVCLEGIQAFCDDPDRDPSRDYEAQEARRALSEDHLIILQAVLLCVNRRDVLAKLFHSSQRSRLAVSIAEAYRVAYGLGGIAPEVMK